MATTTGAEEAVVGTGFGVGVVVEGGFGNGETGTLGEVGGSLDAGEDLHGGEDDSN